MLTPTEIKQLCLTYGLSPSKKYGQNYLIQEKPIQDILIAGAVKSTDTVIEVGPGFGVLTFPLLSQAGHVLAFEIEQTLRPYWDEQVTMKHDHALEVIWGNVLTEFPKIVFQLPDQYKVIANVPYQITSHLLRTFLEAPKKPERIVVMVQKEVAERVCAKPGDMSLLAVSVQYYGVPKIVSKVTKGNFFPMPKVDSAILQITDIRHTGATGMYTDEAFFRVVRAGFSNKRKKLVSNLAHGLTIEKQIITDIIIAAGLKDTVRAEELSVEAWKHVVTQMECL